MGPVIRKARAALAAAVLVGLMIAVTGIASADTGTFSSAGAVVYVGPSLVPGFPTTSSSAFHFGPFGRITSVDVTTQNEQVISVLGGVTSCADGAAGAACAYLNTQLTGAQLNSLHTSTATLAVTSTSIFQFPTQFGTIPVRVLNGNLSGNLVSNLSVTNGGGSVSGTASLGISGTGTYACFVVLPDFGPVPSPLLLPCVLGLQGAMMFPIVLNVNDTGAFSAANGTGSLAGVTLAGSVAVTADLAGPLGPVSGTVLITSGAFTTP
jgi:hypothetical protein